MGIRWRLVPDVAFLVQSVGGVGDVQGVTRITASKSVQVFEQAVGADIS